MQRTLMQLAPGIPASFSPPLEPVSLPPVELAASAMTSGLKSVIAVPHAAVQARNVLPVNDDAAPNGQSCDGLCSAQ